MPERLSPGDPNSFARPDLVIVREISLTLNIDFVKCILSGKVHLAIEKIKTAEKQLILDIKDLNIFEIKDNNGTILDYTISDTQPEIGSKLTINLLECSDCPNRLNVIIEYETSKTASALQWLTPVQTSGKVHPFLFSQGQPTEMRTVLPCQDTPSVKTIYKAEITAPSDLTVLMSAQKIEQPENLGNGLSLHKFHQKVPIPSYLIAIAAGDLQSRKIGPRSHVWAEKELISMAEYDFGETEEIIQTAENICGPYVWGIYDILVLPPSFAYGGMENPCLTFVTPTILTGDRSLASVVAHEVAHSWTGNLVTNANFEHFWLNEGFTTFTERKILGHFQGAKMQDFDAIRGIVELQDTLHKMGETNPLTKLVLDLTGIHPDDSFSKVPYEKGQLFLRYLEQLVGGPQIFEQFFKTYLDKFKYQSIVTSDFKDFFTNYFKDNQAITAINWNCWLNEPGFPPVLPKLDDTLTKACIILKTRWLEWDTATPNPFSKCDINSFSVGQICQLLNELLEGNALSIDKVKAMESVYEFSAVPNSEIKCRWLRLCIKSHWSDKIEPTLKFITDVGRMKYVNDLYRELYDWEFSRQKAIDNYLTNKEKLMHCASKAVAKILHIST